MNDLQEKIGQLPPEYQQEVIDFIDFLLEKRIKKGSKKPAFSWAGALKDLREKYSSVELQHELSKLRNKIG